MCFGDEETFMADGLGREILDRSWKYGGEAQHFVYSYSIRVEALKRAYDDLLIESGADFLLETRAVDAVHESGHIEYVIVAGRSDTFAIKAKTYVDCTGDGVLSVWAGAPYDKGDEAGRMMPATLCTLWAGVDWDRVRHNDGRFVEQAYADGVFSSCDLHLSGMWKISGLVGGGNIGHAFGADGTDERSLTRALIESRKRLPEYVEYYRKYLDGFENVELVASAAMMGVRETRRVECHYRLVLQDFIDQSVFDDEIGRYCYNIDIHPMDEDPESYREFRRTHTGYRYQTGGSYGVPYRALVPLRTDNLLLAGRCICTDRYMQSSTRVMPGCFITGQAAGTAAALCAADRLAPHGLDPRRIQSILKGIGAYLPNYDASL
jgi:hypothetical protein